MTNLSFLLSTLGDTGGVDIEFEYLSENLNKIFKIVTGILKCDQEKEFGEQKLEKALILSPLKFCHGKKELGIGLVNKWELLPRMLSTLFNLGKRRYFTLKVV